MHTTSRTGPAPGRRMWSALLAVLLGITAVATVGSAPTAGAATAATTMLAAGVDVEDPGAVTALWKDIVATTPPMGFTGNVDTCVPGSTSNAFRAAELRSVNAMRALVGVGPVVEDPAWSTMAQKAALMMEANNALSHSPSTDWDCYTAAGAQAAGTSNLYLGTNGVDAMWGYVADPGENNVVVGHRRWLLCPSVTRLGFGDTPWANATKVFDDDFGGPETSRDGFVAWPNPGIVPVNLAAPRGMLNRFSVQVPSGHDTTDAQVTVTSSSGGNVALRRITRNNENYCSPAVMFEPARTPVAGETWTIHITGLTHQGSDDPDIVYQSSFQVLSPSAPFVKAAFTDFLGRLPTASELQVETATIDGGAPRSDLVGRLSKSSEWVSNIVTGFYQDTLGRGPDASGLAYWTNQIATGKASVAKVASLFYASSEYFTTTGRRNTSTWVNDLYVKLLGRQADPGGLTYWVGIATSKGRGTVAFSMYQSQESRQARTTKLYQMLLGRRPDQAGLLYWAGKLRTQGDLALAVNLAGSSEYAARAQTRF